MCGVCGVVVFAACRGSMCEDTNLGGEASLASSPENIYFFENKFTEVLPRGIEGETWMSILRAAQ